ncbi:hypothetical protein [Photobacterium leiognathi]|uniref:hypothetical protein n=1 Tax=Photobacterium leiognathi TaxID=553611 RepID=UPI000D152283|nr:hypothetical protein [Photobacterium leiognathi]PSW58608.1 hypothetical protein C0W50_03350 [Photobacterium leiognathi subsp. mandapamensis]
MLKTFLESGLAVLYSLSFCLLLAACNDSSHQTIADNAEGFPELAQLVAFSSNANSSHLACAQHYRESCLLEQFPPLGVEKNTPLTISDIEQRLFVSHPWMAERFLSVLSTLPSSLLPLFRSVSAIVIADDVRPSFYSANTATIYIDPRYLWRDEEEWLTIVPKDDFRDQFKANVSFLAVRQNVDSAGIPVQWISDTFSARNTTRTIEQLQPALFRLLVHELAHANDLLPPSVLSSLSPKRTIYQNITATTPLNQSLYDQLPLQDALLFNVADVLYQGASPSDAVSELTAAQAGVHFETEGASDLYSYSNRREDLAMLFQSYMMHEHWGLQDQFLFLSQNEQMTGGCERYSVEWGQTGRMFDPLVYERMILVAETLLEIELPVRFTVVLEATPIPPGTSWCEIINSIKG